MRTKVGRRQRKTGGGREEREVWRRAEGEGMTKGRDGRKGLGSRTKY